LIANGRRDEGVEILAKVRGDLTSNDPALMSEVAELEAAVTKSKHPRNNLLNPAFGRHSGRLHLGRRAWMGFWLQQIQQWTGILAIATWAGTPFQLAGLMNISQLGWLAL